MGAMRLYIYNNEQMRRNDGLIYRGTRERVYKRQAPNSGLRYVKVRSAR